MQILRYPAALPDTAAASTRCSPPWLRAETRQRAASACAICYKKTLRKRMGVQRRRRHGDEHHVPEQQAAAGQLKPTRENARKSATIKRRWHLDKATVVTPQPTAASAHSWSCMTCVKMHVKLLQLTVAAPVAPSDVPGRQLAERRHLHCG